MHVEDRQKNSDAVRFVLQHFVFIQIHDIHHCAVRSRDDYVWIYWHCAFGITKKRDSTQKEQHKKPECPCREQPKNDREQRKKSQNPPCFPEGLEAHKTTLFWEPENGWSRHQNRWSKRFSLNHNIVGLAAPKPSISSVNNPLRATRLFVVLNAFAAILFTWGVWPPLLCRKFKKKFRSKMLLPESPQRKNTTRHRSTSSKVSKQSGNGPECLSAIQMNADCIIWFTKFSIIRSTNISPDFAQRSKRSFTWMDRSRCATMAAAFRSTFIRNGRCRLSSWC